MTRQRLIILFSLLTNFAFGQNLNYRDYVTNDEEVFSSIDSNYLNYYIKELKINNLKEIKYYYDTLGMVKDSSFVNYYSFDTTGRVIEHRYDYRFKSTKYRSVKYTYSKNWTINKTFDDPFGPDYVLSGMYVSNKLPLYCEYRNNSYQIETINIKTEIDGNISTMKFYYDQDLFVKYFYYREFLISGLDFLDGDRIKYRHKIIYAK